ncbi:MAG: RHS repeat protein, partial [Sedimentisphaerales bacterium]|nr:RHS repeat protein [Sedimentisphaerales bacterium]
MSNSADKSSISPSLWTHIAFVFDAACEKVHGGDPMAHNDAGNLCSDDNSYSYHYDYENRLTQITKPDGPDEGSDPDPVASYTYDALGRRIE